ncbi:histidine phosphotransferase family protein [Oceanibaculum pacificum]|uniref:Histidine phosphotransferase ChpT C-terminal domain-containing protein n=1 Tax=Oceanibaculum pacificum TaxID=580166 RepID=A0A154VFH8_9PROT|nr:histidine phosphotransferase family protein [Oceanibaculum pacificum]KZD00066.1 hypothetical protein AUP43_14370 [Oceanibaculum pacificum]
MHVEMRVMDLLMSRLCHDLISPVGAIVNGLELIEEMGDELAQDALDLVGRSARQAAAKLSLYRIAYGIAGDRNDHPLSDGRKLLAAYLQESKVVLDWRPETRMDSEGAGPGVLRAVLALALVGIEALPRGGSLTLSSAETPDGISVQIEARGVGARLEAAAATALSDETAADDLDSRSVVAFVAGVLARRLGGRVETALETDRVRLTLSLPPRPEEELAGV